MNRFGLAQRYSDFPTFLGQTHSNLAATILFNNASSLTLNFENSFSKNIEATATTGTNTLPLPYINVTVSNIKDGGRYAVVLNGSSSTYLTFPSNVYKADGTLVGNYANDSGALVMKFYCIGTKLIMEE